MRGVSAIIYSTVLYIKEEEENGDLRIVYMGRSLSFEELLLIVPANNNNKNATETAQNNDDCYCADVLYNKYVDGIRCCL